MEARDFRSIGRAAQEALRRRAIVLIEREGVTQAVAAKAVGVQRQTVNLLLKRYRAGGEASVLDGRRTTIEAMQVGEIYAPRGVTPVVGLGRVGRQVEELDLVPMAVHPGLDLLKSGKLRSIVVAG